MGTGPDQAFILTAGKGTRLRPYTDDKPKPMVEVGGKPILEHTVEKLENFGVQNITMNLFYLGDRIENYFKGRKTSNITFSQEEELLETGGGVKKALHMMKGEDFYMINGDALWADTDTSSALAQLAQSWNPKKMDILLLLQPVKDMSVTHGVGDYDMDETGAIIRTPDQSGKYMFTGLRISKPDVFEGTPEGAFSFLECMDAAQENGTLYGIEHKGTWHHISTPEDLDSVNAVWAREQHKKKAS